MAGININNAVYNLMISNFGKTVTIKTYSSTENPLTGEDEQTLTGTSTATIAFFRREDVYKQEYIGLLRSADAIALLPTTTSINRDDIIVYNGEEFKVTDFEPRMLGSTLMYNTAWCFRL